MADENSFAPVRILTTWNKAFSVFYTTVADVRGLYVKLNNKQKINFALNNRKF